MVCEVNQVIDLDFLRARIGPALGSSVTEVTQTAPNELTFKRTASAGLTAIELRAFADWLEAPKFPAFDLRLPPPRVRPGQKPFNLPFTPRRPRPRRRIRDYAQARRQH